MTHLISVVDIPRKSRAMDVSDIVPDVPIPYFNEAGKKFLGKGVGAQRTLKPVDEFWLFLTRVRLGLFERSPDL